MKCSIKLAGIPIEVNTKYCDFYQFAKDYITEEKPIFSVGIDDNDILLEREKSIKECELEGIPYPGYSSSDLELTAVYRKIAENMPKYNAFVFHGSAVAIGDEAYVFTAKSGTGKTTHTRLWLQNIEGSYVVNGDKPIIRFTEDKAFVCGTPWMGKEKLGINKVVPLKSICILSRGVENKIETADYYDNISALLGQTYRPEDGDMLVKTVEVLGKIGRSVKLYKLLCNMNPEAAKISFAGMNGKD